MYNVFVWCVVEGGLHVSELFSLSSSIFVSPPPCTHVQEQIDQLQDELRRTKLDSRQDRFHLDSLELEAQLLRSQKKEMDRLVHAALGLSCRKSSPAELVPPGLKRQRSACRIGSALPNKVPHFKYINNNILLFLPYVYICTQMHYIRHTTIIVQVSNASTYYANSRIKDTK